MIRTVTVFVSKRTLLGEYFEGQGVKVNNLFNRSNFLIRQAMTGTQKSPVKRHSNEKESLALIESVLPAINEIKISTFNKQVRNEKDLVQRQMLLEKGPVVVEMPTADNWYLNNTFLKQILQESKDRDYEALQRNLAQRTIQTAGDAWSSYFKNLKQWKANPQGYTGKPKIPKYRKKGHVSTIIFTNQNCRFLHKKKATTWLLSFPSTSEKLNVTGLLKRYPMQECELCEVKAVPVPNGFDVQITYDDGLEKPNCIVTPTRIVSIDLGVANFAALSNNVGLPPILLKGDVLKRWNQWYNKQIAYYQGIAKVQNKQAMTRRIQQLWYNRDRFLKNMIGLITNEIIKYLQETQIDTVVCGWNTDWKRNVNMGHKNNQEFVYIPYGNFLETLTSKCAENGIQCIKVEESYTSKASFLDWDEIPTYQESKKADENKETGQETEEKPNYQFSGRRIHRGLYRAKDGRLLNADINGASNILRKNFPEAFQNVSSFNYLMNPICWRIRHEDGKTKIEKA